MKQNKSYVAYQIKKNGEHGQIMMKDTLEDLYKYTECDIIDIVYAKIGKNYYDIIVDDEGLLKENNLFTAFAVESNSLLAGSIVIVGSDGQGGFKSLTNGDLLNITMNLHGQISRLGNNKLADTMVEFEYAHYS